MLSKCVFVLFAFFDAKTSFHVDGADVRHLFGVVGREGLFVFVVVVMFFHIRFLIVNLFLKIVCKSCENRHLFHVHCVEQWFEHAPNRSCPVCRGVI